MNDNVFLDTNILVYSYSSSELSKLKIAREIIGDNNSFISTHVLQDYATLLHASLSLLIPRQYQP